MWSYPRALYSLIPWAFHDSGPERKRILNDQDGIQGPAALALRVGALATRNLMCPLLFCGGGVGRNKWTVFLLVSLLQPQKGGAKKKRPTKPRTERSMSQIESQAGGKWPWQLCGIADAGPWPPFSRVFSTRPPARRRASSICLRICLYFPSWFQTEFI